MTIKYHPKVSELLRCNFGRGFKPPEIVKMRPVVVLSSKTLGRGKLCTVVPLSTVKPVPIKNYHVELSEQSKQYSNDGIQIWVKCDMIMTVAFDRLSAFRDINTDKSYREYVKRCVTREDMEKIKEALKIVLLPR